MRKNHPLVYVSKLWSIHFRNGCVKYGFGIFYVLSSRSFTPSQLINFNKTFNFQQFTYTISVIRSCGRTDSVFNERNECCMSSLLYSSFSSGPSGIMNSFLHTSLINNQKNKIHIIASIQLKVKIHSHRFTYMVFA